MHKTQGFLIEGVFSEMPRLGAQDTGTLSPDQIKNPATGHAEEPGVDGSEQFLLGIHVSLAPGSSAMP